MPSFSVLQSQHAYTHFHHNTGSKWTHKSLKKQLNFVFLCLFCKVKVTCMPAANFIFQLFTVNALFLMPQVNAYVCTFPFWKGLKKNGLQDKKMVTWLKNIPMRLNFQDESHLYANCLFFVLTTYVCSDIFAATKIFIYCYKSVLSKLNFQDKDHLYVNCFFYIFIFQCKSLAFQFLSCGIRMHIPILAWV